MYRLQASVHYTPIVCEFENMFGRRKSCIHLLVTEHLAMYDEACIQAQ